MLLSEGMDYRMYGIHVLLGTGTLEGKRKKGLIGGSIVLLYNTDIRGGRSQVLAAGLEVRSLGRKTKKGKRMVQIVVTSAPATSKSIL